MPARISEALPVPRISRLPTNPPQRTSPAEARSFTTAFAVAPSATVNVTSFEGPSGADLHPR